MTNKLTNTNERTVLVYTPKFTHKPRANFFYQPMYTSHGLKMMPTYIPNKYQGPTDAMIFNFGKIFFSFICLGGLGMTIGGAFLDKNIDPDRGLLGAGVTLLIITIIVSIVYWRCFYKPQN